MTADQWFALGRDVVMLTITALVFWWGRSRRADERLVEDKFTAIEKRLDHGGQQMSDLADDLQPLLGLMSEMERLREWRHHELRPELSVLALGQAKIEELVLVLRSEVELLRQIAERRQGPMERRDHDERT